MSNNKIHIDSLFSNGLKNIEIPAFAHDLDKIKKGIEDNQLNVFSYFELPITENDWQTVKARLEKENEKILPLIPLNDIGNGFKNFEIGITDSDWQNTKQKLAQAQGNKKRKLVWFWWLNAIIISVFSAIGIHNYLNKSVENISLSNSNQPVKESNAQFNHLKENNFVKPNEKSFNQDNNSIKNSPNNSNSLVQKDLNKNKLVSTEKVKINVDKVVENNSIIKNEIISKAATKTKTFEIIEIKDLKNDVFKNDEQISNKKIKEIIEDKTENKITDNTTEKLKEELKTIEPKPLDTAKKQDKKEDPKKLLPKFYIGINTQLAQSHRTLSNTNKPLYNSVRNNAEKPFTQLSIGFVTGVQKGKNEFQLGAQYTQQNWTSNYSYNYKIYDSLPLKDPNGNIIGYFLTRGRDTTINENQTIKISKIDIPFNYQYHQKLNSKTNLLLGFGGVLGINIKTEGSKIINPVNNYLYPYKALSKNENNLSFSPQLNIGLQRNLNKNLLLQTNILGNYSATSRFKNQYGVKDFPYSVGLSLKLLYLIH